MITETTALSLDEAPLMRTAAKPGETFFFDIETTGFRPQYCRVYLIGVAYRGPRGWQIQQWLSEAAGEEPVLLRIFAQFAAHFKSCIHFNGTRFDIPFLEKRFEVCQIPSPFADLMSIDLYRAIRPLRHVLKLKELNQKYLERFLGIDRDDRCDGGELIRVFQEFCKTGTFKNRHLLLLHNLDDVNGMTRLLRFAAYEAVFEPVADPVQADDRDQSRVLFSWELPLAIPRPLTVAHAPYHLQVHGRTAQLSVFALSGTLKYFFPNFKEYYYLPAEDTAIHKSVAAYVDPAFRVQATKKNCYTNKEGLFLPQPEPLITPFFRTAYEAKQIYFLMDQSFTGDQNKQKHYLCTVLKTFLGKD